MTTSVHVKNRRYICHDERFGTLTGHVKDRFDAIHFGMLARWCITFVFDVLPIFLHTLQDCATEV